MTTAELAVEVSEHCGTGLKKLDGFCTSTTSLHSSILPYLPLFSTYPLTVHAVVSSHTNPVRKLQIYAFFDTESTDMGKLHRHGLWRKIQHITVYRKQNTWLCPQNHSLPMVSDVACANSCRRCLGKKSTLLRDLVDGVSMQEVHLTCSLSTRLSRNIVLGTE